MTLETLREIFIDHGQEHALFCLKQEATQKGRDALAPLFAELDRLIRDDDADYAQWCEDESRRDDAREGFES